MSGLRYWPLVPRFWFSFVVNSRGAVFFGVWERFLWGEGRVRGSGGIQNEGYNFLGFLIVLFFFCSFSAQEIRTRFLCLVGTEEKEVKKL